MKISKYVMICSLFVLLLSCGGESTDATKPTNIKDARQQLTAKKQELSQLKKDIQNLKDIIAELDPSSVEEKEVLVKIGQLEKKNFKHFVEVQGSVMPANDPGFASSETGGRILKLLVKEGDVVKKGVKIAEVNLESIKKSIIQLQTSLGLAKDIYQRQENLWKQNIGSEVQYLQAKNQVESLEKNIESLEFELTKANVFAPVSGVVDNIMVKEGEMAGPGTPIAQILNVRSLKVVAKVPEVYLGKIKKGERVKVRFPALDLEQEVKVSMIGRVINPVNRTFEVEASIRNTGYLKPNLMSTMFVNDYVADDVLVIADQYIQQDVSGNFYVMLVNDNRAVKQTIQLGRSYQNETEVIGGLSGVETIIFEGGTRVQDGDLVKVIQ